MPGAEAVQIHIANGPSDVIGCIGVGESIGNDANGDLRLLNSKTALTQIDNIIAADGSGDIVVIIRGAGTVP